jgi:hypothetical protein
MKKLLLAILLTGCGKEGRDISNYSYTPYTERLCTVNNLFTKGYDPLMHEPIVKFSIDARKRNVPCFPTEYAVFSDELSVNSKGVLGYCDFSYGIFINRDHWMWFSAQTRITLIYHELGHCALGLDHYDDSTDIMNTYILSDFEIGEEWNKLVSNLFRRRK